MTNSFDLLVDLLVDELVVGFAAGLVIESPMMHCEMNLYCVDEFSADLSLTLVMGELALLVIGSLYSYLYFVETFCFPWGREM